MNFNIYCKSYWTWHIGAINSYFCRFRMTYWLTYTYCCSSAMTYCSGNTYCSLRDKHIDRAIRIAALTRWHIVRAICINFYRRSKRIGRPILIAALTQWHIARCIRPFIMVIEIENGLCMTQCMDQHWFQPKRRQNCSHRYSKHILPSIIWVITLNYRNLKKAIQYVMSKAIHLIWQYVLKVLKTMRPTIGQHIE